jgi:glycerol-3-phosphate acyltransferase PlsX
MKIAVDAMGGDNAPKAVIEGVVGYVKDNPSGADVILVGDEVRIKDELARLKAASCKNISIFHASQVIEMHESPVLAIRKKKDSSVVKAASLVKEGKADALVSAGNTGALVASTKIKWRSLPGIQRPAIATVMPAPHGAFVLLDAGATPDCSPLNLLQFALMGNVYANDILNIKNPKVGILSFGAEESKGTSLTKEAFKLLQSQSTQINFVGNVEGSDLFTDKVDVIVCEGFMGNVILKTCESLAGALQHTVKEEIMKSALAKIGALLILPTFKRLAKKLHYEEYGGAPLLGVNGICIKSHGRSSPKAIQNAMRVAEYMVKKEMNKHIIESVSLVQAIPEQEVLQDE